MKKIFNEEQIEFMKQHYKDMSYKEIANYLGFTERQVRGKINGLGLSKLRKIKSDYFSIIDTPLKAYFLGFIFADGYLVYNPNRRVYELGIELQEDDKYILDLLNLELGNLNNIYYTPAKKVTIEGIEANRKPTYCLRIYSKQIVEDLIQKGIVPNKTHHTSFPKIQEEYFFDFLRGYIDGDGCYYIDKYNCVNIHITSAFDDILYYLQNKLLDYDIQSSVYKEKERKYRLYIYRKDDANKLVHLLYYDNVVCLKRKFNKINNILLGSPT